MKFFQNSVLHKHQQAQDQESIRLAWHKFTSYFHNPEIQQNIREAKEEQFQEGFLRELFVGVLGYVLNPSPNYNLTTELKNEKGAKKADGAILSAGKALAVIELKGTDTKDLDKINVQAFNYKNNHPGCIYVITSNFEKLRFFIHHSVDSLEFNLFTLTEAGFNLLWLCLAAENLLNGVPLKVKEDSLLEEEKVTKQLYKDYSAFRTELWQNMVKNSPEADRLLLFKKTQKLLDRYLFILFAEDSGLLPPNSIGQILKRWEVLKEEDAYKPLYKIFNQYFGYINTGRKGKTPEGDIFAYNGGLFLPDEVLDYVVIDDEILYTHVSKLTKYDFQSEIDVNILGHIFENSLTEIENITAEIEGQELDKSKTKRKKDGVFYTPKYITKYIVDNTLGKLCDEKKAELEIVDEEYAKGRRNRKKETIKKLADNLQAYRNWLLGLTICDPACGSGAFLNQALEFLIEEHTYIDELHAQLFGASIVFQDISNHILEQNIYGVDINEESVEIAKLSLWLRTAQRGRKLTTLNNNIKCGNSLIDDPAVAGEKAFNWQQEFPVVFAKGGFDVVIGNPPYVRVQQMEYITTDYLKDKYIVAQKRVDISLCFIELSRKLIKELNGITCFITSNQFLTTEYGQAMRKFLLNDYNLVECVDFGDLPIFADALTYVSIFSFRKTLSKEFIYFHVESLQDAMSSSYKQPITIKYEELSDSNWNLKNFKVKKIWNRIFIDTPELSELGNACYGIITGADHIFIFSKDQYQNTEIEKNLFIPLLRAQNCSRYYCFKAEKYVLYPYRFESGKTVLIQEKELNENFPKAYQYLLSHKTELENRKDSRDTFLGRSDWYCLTRYGQINVFNKLKIVTPGEVKEHKFCVDSSKSGYSGARVFAIIIDDNNFDEKYILCLLNSTLMKSYLQSFSSLKNGGYFSYSSNILNKVPVKRICSFDQNVFINKADQMLSLNITLQETSQKFQHTMQRRFLITELPDKLADWYLLSYAEFVAELRKKKIKLSLSDEAEWEEYFVQEQKKALELKAVIETTDREIDRMVYQLYGLTADEIQIVEQA